MMASDKERFFIRPSQVTRTFGPGSIYDNQRDSMIIMGLDFWKDEKFKSITDQILLQEIKKNNKGFDNVDRLVSVSSFEDPDTPGTIPIRSFPTWGFCPRCDKLVSGRNTKTGKGKYCNSSECHTRYKNEQIDVPKTYPVRFVAACKKGHLDDFPWYEWVHRSKTEKDACSREDAELYLLDDSKSMSLDSKTVRCKKCDARDQKMSMALSKNGLQFIGFNCTKRKPWLDKYSRSCEDEDGEPIPMKGLFKGATNIYFPLVRSAVTIPPFSDDLAGEISKAGSEIHDFRKNYDRDFFEKWLEGKFHLKSEKFPDGRWTLNQVLDKIAMLEEFANKNKEMDIYKLEFDALNSDEDASDREFVTENLTDTSAVFKEFVSKIVLVKKTRVVSAITGFTRIDSYDPDSPVSVSGLSHSPLTWLPAVENRGEGIFFSFNNRALDEWQTTGKVKERFKKIMTLQGKVKTDPETRTHNPKYVFLHTFSHIVIKSLAKLAGYSTASFTERIYCGKGMAGIFIYTSSPSSDGALGGLVELGRKNENRLWDILEDAVFESRSCSCDPLCSLQESGKNPQLIGAACHACTLLPETCCENMNSLLDREMIDRTLRADSGFLKL